MDIVSDQQKISENDVCEFYVNNWTKEADKWAKDWGLKGVRCLVAIQKSDKSQDYILVYNGEVVYAHTSYESIGAHIDMMALAQGLKRENSW